MISCDGIFSYTYYVKEGNPLQFINEGLPTALLVQTEHDEVYDLLIIHAEDMYKMLKKPDKQVCWQQFDLIACCKPALMPKEVREKALFNWYNSTVWVQFEKETNKLTIYPW